MSFMKMFMKKIGLSDQEYMNQINSGKYSESKFVHDAVEFDLTQWTYHTIKQALYNKWKWKIENLNCKLEYLISELTIYFGVINKLLRS